MASLKPLKGADLKGAAAALAIVPGVAGLTAGTTSLELHADLEKLTMESLKEAAAKFNCDIIVSQTFEYVKYKLVEGAVADYIAAADLIKGVMTVGEADENVVGMWVNKSQLKLDQLEKIQGYKVERQ